MAAGLVGEGGRQTLTTNLQLASDLVPTPFLRQTDTLALTGCWNLAVHLSTQIIGYGLCRENVSEHLFYLQVNRVTNTAAMPKYCLTHTMKYCA